MVIFRMSFLVCKLYKLVLYMTTYFWHEECFIFIWEQKLQDSTILLLAIFLDLQMTQFWSVNYICHVFEMKLFLWTCPKFWTIRILIGFYMWLLLNIFYQRSTAIVLGTVLLDTFSRLWKLLFFEEKIFKILLYLLLIQKPVTSITQEWLVVESCLTPQWRIFLMFYRLVCNMRYQLNDLILAWSAVLQ